MDHKEIEARIQNIKRKREKLINQKAEKVAILKNAQEQLRELKQEVEAEGYELNAIPTILEERKKALLEKLEEVEASLDKAEALLNAYE